MTLFIHTRPTHRFVDLLYIDKSIVCRNSLPPNAPMPGIFAPSAMVSAVNAAEDEPRRAIQSSIMSTIMHPIIRKTDTTGRSSVAPATRKKTHEGPVDAELTPVTKCTPLREREVEIMQGQMTCQTSPRTTAQERIVNRCGATSSGSPSSWNGSKACSIDRK